MLAKAKCVAGRSRRVGESAGSARRTPTLNQVAHQPGEDVVHGEQTDQLASFKHDEPTELIPGHQGSGLTHGKVFVHGDGRYGGCVIDVEKVHIPLLRRRRSAGIQCWPSRCQRFREPPAQLVDFLAADEPPVYVGFGSMGFGKEADERRDAILAALRVHGLRGIVATGWGGITPGAAGSDDVLVIEGAPHEWLFPRVAAVVHHGGAGSTAAGLRAGRPTLVVPFLGDQPFWGARVHALGAGPAPLPARNLRTGLTGRLGDLVHTDSYASRAVEVGAAIRSENGLAVGVHVLEQITGVAAVDD